MRHAKSLALLRRGARVLVLCLLPFGAVGEVFVEPALTLEGGHDSNPYRYTEEVSSSFIAWEPAVGLAWFRTPETEIRANLSYRQVDFMDDPFSSTRTWSGDAAAWRYASGHDLSLNVGAGLYEDDFAPDDNLKWASVGSMWKRTADNDFEIWLRLSGHGMFYDSRETLDGEKQRDGLVTFGPGIQWPLGTCATMWAEMNGEYLVSNGDESKYFGFGGSVGLEGEIKPVWRCGAGLDVGMLQYVKETADVPDENEYPVRAAIWSTYRVKPWLEFFISADHMWYGGGENSEYTRWTARAGVRLTGEFVPACAH